LGTRRDGIGKLVEYLEASDFFIAPASMRYHGCHVGGLAKHSFNVYERLLGYNALLGLGIEDEHIIIAALLHDVCKIGAYVKREGGLSKEDSWYWNRAQPKGHALLSLVRIAEHIKLLETEVWMVQYHMGVYGLMEFDPMKGEYTLRNKAMAYAWHHRPIVKVMYFCDELVTLGEKPGV